MSAAFSPLPNEPTPVPGSRYTNVPSPSTSKVPSVTEGCGPVCICMIVDTCQPFRAPRSSQCEPAYCGASQSPLMVKRWWGLAATGPNPSCRLLLFEMLTKLRYLDRAYEPP